MTSRPRTDILINLPALRKLDYLLLVRVVPGELCFWFMLWNFTKSLILQEILDSFTTSTEFWYVDQDVETPEADGSASFRQVIQRQEDKWWLPVPRVHPSGLLDDTRKKLIHKRECAAQVLKAAMAINSTALAEMEVPESYMANLPKV